MEPLSLFICIFGQILNVRHNKFNSDGFKTQLIMQTMFVPLSDLIHLIEANMVYPSTKPPHWLEFVYFMCDHLWLLVSSETHYKWWQGKHLGRLTKKKKSLFAKIISEEEKFFYFPLHITCNTWQPFSLLHLALWITLSHQAYDIQLKSTHMLDSLVGKLWLSNQIHE